MDGSKLQHKIEIQSGLDQSIDQFLSIAAGIKSKKNSSPPQGDNNGWEELKEFRRKGLLWKLQSFNHDLVAILEYGSSTMKELKKATRGTESPHQTCQS
jgi:hypothetical protein